VSVCRPSTDATLSQLVDPDKPQKILDVRRDKANVVVQKAALENMPIVDGLCVRCERFSYRVISSYQVHSQARMPIKFPSS
jgi:hypothetical protein